MDNIIPIRVLPIRDDDKEINYDFTNVTMNLTDNIIEPGYNYDHTGKYIVTSSSCMYDVDDSRYKNHGPFVAFNNYNNESKKSKNNFFLCDMNGSPERAANSLPYTKYTQNPYAYAYNDGVAPYQGGGALQNTWSTMINGKPIYGEWLQIQLPKLSGVFLFKYGILIPDSWTDPISFPKKFVVVGSKDGQTWNFLDQQNLTEKPDDGFQEFNINSTEKYTYFRLIVCELFSNHTGIIGIKQWSIYGTPHPEINNDVIENDSTDADNGTSESFSNISQTINAYSSQNYSNFKLSSPLNQETIKYNKQNKNDYKAYANAYIDTNANTYIVASFVVLAAGLFMYSTLRK
jgi:hypothetical protein